MMIDTFVAIAVLLFLGLLIWSRVQQQKMLDTIIEIRDIFNSATEPATEVVK